MRTQSMDPQRSSKKDRDSDRATVTRSKEAATMDMRAVATASTRPRRHLLHLLVACHFFVLVYFVSTAFASVPSGVTLYAVMVR